MMKYPIGIQTFSNIIQDGYVYVDKTDMVYNLANSGKVFFLSRPRRFGKSLLLSTLKSYFLGQKELFRGLKIDSLEKEWNVYPVFHLSFGTSNFTKLGTLEAVILDYIEGFEKIYGRTTNSDDYAIRFKHVIKAAHEKTGQRTVVLVDEYDKPLLDVMDNKTLYYQNDNGEKIAYETHNRDILKGFYGAFKDADEDLKFVVLTGVTKFSQVSVFSGFNQPDDISLDEKYESLCGITKEELLTVFDKPIRSLASTKNKSYEDMVAMLTEKYDGYHFSSKMTGIFNPFSILNCFSKNDMRNYWFASGTPGYLVRLLAHGNENINELVGKYYPAEMFIDYKADVEQPLPMIYQSGYLTIKACNPRRQTYLLDFPNEEVRSGFISVLAGDYFKEGRIQPSTWLEDVTDALQAGNVEMFMKQMAALLSSVTYRFQRKQDAFDCERYFQYTFYLIMQMLGRYNTLVEKETSEGRIDCVLECSDYVYILEFKLNGSASAALKQIEDKGYVKPYMADSRKVICLGINFSSEKGTIDDWKFCILNEQL